MPTISCKRACNLMLDIAAHFADVDILFEDEIQVRDNNIVLHFDAHAIMDTALEETIHAARHLCHAADAGNAQRREPRDGNKHIWCNGGFAL